MSVFLTRFSPLFKRTLKNKSTSTQGKGHSQGHRIDRYLWALVLNDLLTTMADFCSWEPDTFALDGTTLVARDVAALAFVCSS